jgi:hypothetical protein
VTNSTIEHINVTSTHIAIVEDTPDTPAIETGHQVSKARYKHPLLSLPAVEPANGPFREIMGPAKKMHWPKPGEFGQTSFSSILGVPQYIKLQGGENILFEEYVCRLLRKALSLIGLVSAVRVQELVGNILKLFFFEDLPKTLNSLVSTLNAYGSRKAWNDYGAAMLQAHRNNGPHTLTRLTGYNEAELAALFEKRTGVLLLDIE